MNVQPANFSMYAPTVKMVERRGFNREQAASYVGICATTFDKLIKDGLMPKAKKIYGRKVWDKSALDEFFEKLPEEGKNAKTCEWDAD